LAKSRSIDHASVVVGFNAGVPLVAAHTVAAVDKSYTAYAAAKYYFIHLPDTWVEIGNQGTPTK